MCEKEICEKIFEKRNLRKESAKRIYEEICEKQIEKI
ncbi:MAG: hypothetical protein K0R05_1908 [Anaerocolumna sp.]|jgi:hypothetical protein|nr:hypothetical protein [Anaerocolumna sp.]